VFADGILDIVVKFGIDFSEGSFHNIDGVSDSLDLGFVVFNEVKNFLFLLPDDINKTFV
jgi:hypothetical protein